MRLWLGSGLLLSALVLTTAGCRRREPPPAQRTEENAPKKEAEPEVPAFKVNVESFADIRILRYQVPGFEALSKEQKVLLYYLQEAARSGRDITYDQNNAHNLAIRRTLEAIYTTYGGDKKTPAFEGLVTYLKRVWFSHGIHHHYSTKKLPAEGFTREDFAAFVKGSDAAKLPLREKESVDALIARLAPVIFDPDLAHKRVNKDADADPIADSANHFYVGALTRDEVATYTKQRTDPSDPMPVSHGLNSQLKKLDDGTLEERVWRVGGMYGAALSECVRWLEKAIEVAENDAQRAALQKLVTFYRTGDLRDWDRYSVAWVADTTSKVDLIHGFIETYGDALDLRGTYEALVELEDEDATKRIRAISKNAQWFEDHSPIPPAYKKKSVVGVSARVIQAVVGAGDQGTHMASGINLPNASWIRQKHGSKSVTLGNIMAAYEAASRDNGVLEEFVPGTRELERAKAYGGMAQALMVDMHEVIGHASGQLAPNVGEASETLQKYAGTLEEARADLVALYYILDPKLVELKLMPSLEVGRAAYDSYIRSALLVQLARVPLGESLEEAHMRNRALIGHWTFERGNAAGVIEKLERGGKTYFVVRDYVKLRKLFGDLLREIQRIKSEGDFESARDLVESYGVKVDPELHRQVRDRYEVLNVAPYAGFIQPELVPVMQGDDVVDVRIEYPEDFAAQQLRLSERYAFLPVDD